MARRYNIEKLLRDGVQPWRNQTEEEKFDLRRTIIAHNKKLDKMPVSLNGEEQLFDGHQRLHELLALGRKTIGESEVIHNYKVKGQRATFIEAVKINDNRRHNTGEARAEVYWEMVRKYGMSQAEIARELGKTQQSVNKLMKKYPAPDLIGEQTTIGADGKARTYTVEDPKPKPRPWTPDGVGTKMVQALRKRLKNTPPVELTDFDKNRIVEEMSWLRTDLTDFITMLTGGSIIDVAVVDVELDPPGELL